MSAGDDAAFEQALSALVADFHPGIVSELDHAERVVAEESREAVAYNADGIFDVTLRCNLALRVADFDLPDSDLAQLAREHRDFFERHLGADGPARLGLGAALAARLDAALAAGDGVRASGRDVPAGAPPGRATAHEARLVNALLRELDDPLTHDRAKAFLRDWIASQGDPWPLMPVQARTPADDLGVLGRWLDELAAAARRAGLERWRRTLASLRCAVVAQQSEGGAAPYDGEYMTGMGHCSRCSMHFMSESAVALGTACESVRWGDGIRIARDFNAAVCPFCGFAERIAAPALFHDGGRGHIVYCVPRAGDEPQSAALSRWGEIIGDARERYAARLAPGERAAFESCTEIVAKDAGEFVFAIWRGDTVPEDHAYNIVTLAGGERMLVDSTKNVMWELLPGEMAG